jgi:DNA-binding transcriptional regulator of glucitol operon
LLGYQKKIELKNKMVEKAVEEKEILQKQFEKVVSELREQSDSESIEEMDFKVELAEKRATIK